MPIHRTIKNVVKNYTPAEVKVREATSNDPWGPTTTLMNEIAELTHSSIALPEVMNMIWKRISDQGKNWRHVLKALNLLEYLAKVGSHQVAEQCKSHIHILQMLGEFQHFEEGKDHGTSIREKSKQFVSLLKDPERFKNERSKALVAKERLAQSSGMGSASRRMIHSTSDRYLSSSVRGTTTLPPLSSEFEAARPSSYGEEDLQLQLALAMSKEEHEGELKRRKEDEFKLQMALEESKKISSEFQKTLQSFSKDFMEQNCISSNTQPPPPPSSSSLLLASPIKQTPSSSSQPSFPSSSTWDSNLHHSTVAPNLDPWGPPLTQNLPNDQPLADPWGMPAVPMASTGGQSAVENDPWAPTAFGGMEGGAVGGVGASWNLQPNNNNTNNDNIYDNNIQQQLSQHNSFPQQQQQQLSQQNDNKDQLDDEFDLLCSRSNAKVDKNDFSLAANTLSQSSNDPFGLGEDLLSGTVWSNTNSTMTSADDSKDDQSKKKMKSVEEFLGANSNLVNLNDLISKPPPSTIANPFMMTSLSARPTTNQVAASVPSAYGGGSSSVWPTAVGQVQPIISVNQTQPFVPIQNYPQQNNPFL